ncbi:hypothetical protein CVT26_006009 [Gymnopilus dilepis]|uniref:Hydrophobin n=1 Tax=Gymnopilus dilepis TaxID=231916 RepID=A0A409Y1F8_9AGAR|nr:hypothetical protein CVT26_006009 [Gymnopilus dilepis]
MFARLYSLFFFLFCAVPLLVHATVLPRGGGRGGDHDHGHGGSTSNNCNTGPVQCCNNVGSAESLGVTSLLSLLGIAVDPITAILGLDCNPISVIGAGRDSSAQPVCCTNNNFNGLINVGCTPINLNL